LAAAVTVAGLSAGVVVGGASASGAATSGTAIPAAQKLVQALEQRPTHIPTSEPITKPIPKGKTIDWLQCSLSTCTILTPAMQAAAKQLGWKVVAVPCGLTPTTVKAAWDVVVKNHPDAVVTSAFPRAIFTSELQKLKSEHIPVVDFSTVDKPGNGITAVVQGVNNSIRVGTNFADYVLATEGKKANALIVSSSVFSTLAPVVTAFKKEMTRLCPTCTVATLNETGTSFGTTLPNDVVAYLKTHPTVNYVVPDESAMNIGLPQALASAGLADKVKITSRYPSQTTAQYLKQGSMDSLLMYQMTDASWQMIDPLARYFAGQSVKPSEVASPMWYLTPKTITKITYPYFLIQHYQTKYEQLWGVKKS